MKRLITLCMLALLVLASSASSVSELGNDQPSSITPCNIESKIPSSTQSLYHPPNVIINGPILIGVNQDVSWQADVASNATDPPFDYEWELDGYPVGLNYHTFYHAFNITGRGTHQLKVTVTDQQNVSRSDTHTFQVQ